MSEDELTQRRAYLVRQKKRELDEAYDTHDSLVRLYVVWPACRSPLRPVTRALSFAQIRHLDWVRSACQWLFSTSDSQIMTS